MRALLFAAVLGLTLNAFANEPAATPAQAQPSAAAETKEASAPATKDAAAPAHGKKEGKKKGHGHK